MDTSSLLQFKRQASFFFKDKIKAARLALLDVTPAQLLTEEATSGDSSVPDTRTMRIISRAAFEVDDYWRVVDILHKRLLRYDRQNWRAAYQAMILLEHLLTHGPARVAEEFQGDQEILREMAKFYYVDEKGFNWGLRVQNKAGKVLKLMEDGAFLKEERARERQLATQIKGFGSFCQRPISTEEGLKDTKCEKYLRCNSHFCDYQSREEAPLVSDDGMMPKAQEIRHRRRDLSSRKPAHNSNRGIGFEEEDGHSFHNKKHQALLPLLSLR